nr:hypothetical protein Hi04_10k_c3780_00004 [uncultured bacterium]
MGSRLFGLVPFASDWFGLLRSHGLVRALLLTGQPVRFTGHVTGRISKSLGKMRLLTGSRVKRGEGYQSPD